MFFPMTPRSRHSGSPLCYALAVILCCVLLSVVQSAEATLRHAEHQRSAKSVRLPNVLIFIVDDLGWNQVGYHAAPAGNEEIQTPHIDAAVAGGIELNRGYVTPWCGPSRAAIMTGRTNVYNANVSQLISSFDDNIGFVAGLPVDTQTIAHSFKKYAASIGKKYTAYYNGKWGIGGTAWRNTPLGLGFDFFRGSWGTGLETCDGLIPTLGVIETIPPTPSGGFGPLMVNTLPGYWEQDPSAFASDMCPYFQSVSNDFLSAEEKAIACKTSPRKPPKIIDLDLLDKVIEQIKTHDFENSGPMLQVFSTMMLHLPMAYPAGYNEADANDNFTNGMPEHFARGKVKPPASIDDNRWATNKGVQFVDDLFGQTLQAIKDAGQWNNTIIYFTSDNGGAIYAGTANNNYPLRASKFSPFEGGIRVPQFISGGWIDQQLPAGRYGQSNTYIFPNDIAPTLLEMAGGDISYLLGGNTGAPYGSPMWEYIKNSLDPRKPKSTHQRVRKVSYTPDMFFDVKVDRTMKFFYTGDTPMIVPRLYEPVWPKTGDLLMDPMYTSIQPCRPGGVPIACCSLNIEEDWQEAMPLEADCKAMRQEAQVLFAIEGGCPKDSNGRNTNPICLEAGQIKIAAPSDLSLWTHYGAAGPFTNAKGQPLNDLPMKCACYGLADGASASDVNYFIVRLLGPSQCGKSDQISNGRPPQSIPCNGSLAFHSPPQQNLLKQYEDVGFNLDTYNRVLLLEQTMLLTSDAPAVLKTLLSYMTRQGRTDWPAINKFPFNVYMDTCKVKGVVPVPFPIVTITPYFSALALRDLTLPFLKSPLGLCAPYSLTQYFCPTYQNPLLKPVIEWHFEQLTPIGVFADGTKWKPMGLVECTIKCRNTAHGTAYIGNGPHGLAV